MRLIPSLLAAIGALFTTHLAAAEVGMHFRRMTGMRVVPTGDADTGEVLDSTT